MSRRQNINATPSGRGGRKRRIAVSDCTDQCMLAAHARKVATFIASGAPVEDISRKLHLLCSNPLHNVTEAGHSLLHVAARHGRYDVIEHFKDQLSAADISRADRESRYTPLHSAVYFGQLHCALLLRQLDANFFAKDSDGHSAHRLASLDRAEQGVVAEHEFFAQPRDCYPQVSPLTWGTNDNSLLGHADVKPRAQPDFLPILCGGRGASMPGGGKRIQPKAAMSKFHMMLLTSHGEVFTCGHGRGGRLGHGSEESELTPMFVAALRKSAVHLIAAGQNHSVFVDTENTLFTCGSNEHGQLGLSAHHGSKQDTISLCPRRVVLKDERMITGVAASRYHTAVITSSKLYVFGTDRGQLGRPESHNTRVAAPFCVPLNYQKGEEFVILEVAASNDVTACLCTAERWHEGHSVASFFVFVCVNHTIILSSCLTSRLCQLNLWTRLSASAVCDTGRAKKSEIKARTKETVVICLSGQNELLSWSCGDSSFRKCVFVNGPLPGKIEKLVVTCKLAIVTSLGEVYTGVPERQRQVAVMPSKTPSKKTSGSTGSGDGLGKCLAHLVELREEVLAGSHFKPFTVKRVPLLDQIWSLAMDPKGDNFAALSALPKIVLPRAVSEFAADLQQFVEDPWTVDTLHDIVFLTKDRTPVYSFKYFLASHSPSVLSRLKRAGAVDNEQGKTTVAATEKFTPDVVRCLVSALCSSWGNTKASNLLSTEDVASSEERLQEVEVTEGMSRCYQALFGAAMPKTGHRSWSPSACGDLSDVVLKTQDGILLKAHKCILVMRSPDYFSHMLLGGWQESSVKTRPISIEVNSVAAKILLSYLYEDTLTVEDSWSCDLLCSVLIAADSFLLSRLKSLCQFHLVSRLSHRNVAELLDISVFVNAEELMNACCDFVYFYFPLVLEARLLDSLPADAMGALPERYRRLLPENRSLPVVDEASVSALFSKDTGGTVDLADDTVDEAVDYVVKGASRRRKLSSSTTERKSSADRKISAEAELEEMIAEMGMDDSTVHSDDDDDDGNTGDTTGDNTGDNTGDTTGDTTADTDDGSSFLAAGENQELLPTGRPAVKSTPIRTPSRTKTAVQHSGGPTTPVGSWMSAGSPSSASPSMFQLSEIMQQQADLARSTTPPYDKSSKAIHLASSAPIDINPAVSWQVGTKKSQSQRKQQKNQQPPTPAATPTPEPKTAPWATASASAASPQPFVDILSEQHVASAVLTPRSLPLQPVPRKSRSGQKPRKVRLDELGSELATKPSANQEIPVSNPWSVPANPGQPTAGVGPSPLPSPSPSSFESIVQSQKEALLPSRSTGKPFGIIQLEEKAMGELKAHYLRRDEVVLVTRVTMPAAPPTWQLRN